MKFDEMKKIPWGSVLIAVVVTAAIVFAFSPAGPLWSRLLLGVMAALSTCIGALVAPASYGAQRLPERELVSRKTWQVIAAGAVTALLVAVGLFDAGVAAIFGVAAALMVGAVMPRSHSEQGQRQEM